MPQLNRESFQALLNFLHPEEPRAAKDYENIRTKLVHFFEWKGCIPGEDYADEAIDRVAGILTRGLERIPENPYLLFHGVAANVVREHWRSPASKVRSIDELPAYRMAAPVAEPELDRSRNLDCMHRCLDRMPDPMRKLLTDYHLSETGTNFQRRKSLAVALDVAPSVLRLRLFRVRGQLKGCVEDCLKRKEC